MKELLCFLAGYVISGAIFIVLMSMMQINRMRENDDLIKSLLQSAHIIVEDKGEPTDDDKE